MTNDKDIERQEKLVSALWGFAYGLQNAEKFDVVAEDGTKMNMEELKLAKEVILAIFGQTPTEIQ